MQLIISILKEFGEFFLRSMRVAASSGKFNLGSEIAALKKEGVFIKPDFLSKQQCEEFRAAIDSYIESGKKNVWVDDEGADQRIYFINDLDEKFNEFYKTPYFREVLEKYMGTSHPSGMLLAARIHGKENNKGSGGGWHRDSPVSHQFKAVCYLNDVGEENGPFQFIKRSHHKMDVIGSYLRGLFKPGQYRFSEAEIDTYLSNTARQAFSVTGSAGDLVLVDTKGIHRGKPLVKGVRYALFCYFWHKDIPEHFSKLMQ